MEVTKLTAAEIAERYDGCENLAGLIHRLEKSAAEQGRVIYQVEVNGLKMTENDESRFSATPMADINEVVLRTENVEVLIQASISSLREWMNRIKEACVEISEKFRLGESGDEQTRFAKLMDAYRELIQTIGVIKTHVESRAEEPARFNEQWATSETHTSHAVRELFEAYERNDRILVADILEYELYGCLDRWLELIRLPD